MPRPNLHKALGRELWLGSWLLAGSWGLDVPCDDGMSPASSLGGLCASPVSGNSIIYGNRTGRTQQPWNDARKPDPSWALLVLTTRSAPGETDDPQDLRCEAHEAHHCPSFFLSPLRPARPHPFP